MHNAILSSKPGHDHEIDISEATMLFSSPRIDPFQEDSDKGADRVFYFEEGPKDTPKLTSTTLAKNEGSKDFGDVLMILSQKNWQGLVVPMMRSIPKCWSWRPLERY